jgi:hypothetical protein
MLAVVQDEQAPPVAELLDQWVEPGDGSRVGVLRVPADRPQAQEGGHGVGDRPRVGQGRQLDQPHSVGQLPLRQAADLKGEAGLADPGRPGEGDQPALPQQPADGRQLLVPSDEAGQRGRQVGRRLP